MPELIDTRTRITGTQMSYLFICRTKLWYFSHHITMEHSSDLVAQGRLVHETTYSRERKDARVGGISIDFVRKGNVIELHEVKKSKKMEKAHEMQALYYIYTLRKGGVQSIAVLDYPLIRERKTLELDAGKEAEIEAALGVIGQTVSLPVPPQPERKRFCPKCAYYELCWAE